MNSGLKRTNENCRVNPCIVQADVPVHVRTGCPASRTDFADHAATRHLITDLHVDFRHVAEHADEALPMVDKHGVAIEEVIAGQDDFARCRGFDRYASRYGEIQSRVRVALFAVEETTHTELARQRAVDRLVQNQIARRAGTETAVGADLLGQFALDPLIVFRVGVDLTLVLEGDVLFRVLLAADLKLSVRPPEVTC